VVALENIGIFFQCSSVFILQFFQDFLKKKWTKIFLKFWWGMHPP